MVSAVVTTIPADGVDANKADIRANWTTLKEEIEALQAGGGGLGLLGVDDEGTEVVSPCNRLNFVGAGVTVTDAGGDEATITIPGGGAGTGEPEPTRVTASTSPFVLTAAHRMTENVIIVSGNTGIVFQVPAAAAVNNEWRIEAKHTGCTVALVAGGTLVPNPTVLISGGYVIVTIDSNAGSAPVALVRGEFPVPGTLVTGDRTYTLADHGKDFTCTAGIQLFPIAMAAAGLPNGWFVNIFNANAGNLTVDGLDNNHLIPPRGAVLVRKWDDGSLGCNGAGGATVLDAA